MIEVADSPNTDAKAPPGAVISAFLLAIAGVVAMLFWRAFVAGVLWGWYITPAFGWAVPSLQGMLGLTVVAWAITRPTKEAVEDKQATVKETAKGIVFSFGALTSLLVIGWIARGFV